MKLRFAYFRVVRNPMIMITQNEYRSVNEADLTIITFLATSVTR